jgi:acetolactate synthase I/II/III large subunit
MKASDYITQFIESQGCHFVFGYIGGAITHLVDSISKSKKVQFIQVYHEQTASFAAEGYSRGSSSVGFCMATSGPGATNLITGIADAFFDSIPLIVITGQVNTYEYKYDTPVRQRGFQETDIVAIVKPITKYAVLIEKKEMIRYELEKAVAIAKKGRPGPVVIDIPMNIQREDVDPDSLPGYSDADSTVMPDVDWNRLGSMIAKSERPIILAGGGTSNYRHLLYEFAEKFNIPVVVSLMGKSCFPENNDLFMGMIGSYGNRCANIALANADLVLAVGSRLDTRQTGTNLDSFIRDGKIIHVDIDPNETNHSRTKRDFPIACDARIFLQTCLDSIENKSADRSAWNSYISELKQGYNQKKEVENFVKNKSPYSLMTALSEVSGENTAFCVDIGQNQMFAAQGLILRKGQSFFTSGGMAPMGYAIPLAIGISFASNHNRTIIAIAGDGGFHISTQSLMLLSQYKLPIKVIVMNNKSLGMIEQFQGIYFDGNDVATTKAGGYHVPEIQSIADAYRLKYKKVLSPDAGDNNLWNEIFSYDGPMIIEVVFDEPTIVSPKLEVNMPIQNLSPKLSDEEMNRAMFGGKK